MSKRILVCDAVSFSFDTKKICSNISFSIGNEKIGLVGSNGVGKSTLIRLLVGQLKPQTGTIVINGTFGYLPQQFHVHQKNSIAHVLGIDQKLSALEKIQAGTGTPDDFECIGDNWDIYERVKVLLSKLNLGHLDITRVIKTLSGGETTRVFLASLLVNNPDLLILDEPTNNLDHESRCALYEVINSFNGGVLVVSHDRKLLSFMDQIIELSSLGAKTYGGNFAHYIEQKKIEQEALEQDIIDAQKQLHKTKKTLQQSKERQEKKSSSGKKESLKGGQPKLFLGFFKEHAEKTKSKLEANADKQLGSARERLQKAKAKLEQKELMNFDLEATRVHNSKLVLDVQNLTFAYPDSKSLIKDFNLTIVGPKRIAISGPNGSGKTTLLKLIMQDLHQTSGTIKIGVDYRVYLDQKLSILNNEETILENFKRLNQTVKETDCRLRLAAFLFAHDDALQCVGSLSGGEKMRAALACILMGETPPQLIILDEPTNNMDLESITSMETALQNYQGALIVVSHDDVFLENIGIQTTIHLKKAV